MTTAAGFGTINWWGFSPACNLLSHLAGPQEEEEEEEEGKNILLVGAGDIRHVLETIAANKSPQRKMNFYIVDSKIPQYARHLLLLHLIFDPKISLQDKAEMFLEIYGNLMVRAKTSEYVKSESSHLVELITDPEMMDKDLPGVSVKALKFRERDEMEDTLKQWRQPEKFAALELWDMRLREYYKQRYDARSNLTDWDYSMKLKDKAPIVNDRQFSTWRLTGTAFELRDAPYDIPNQTLHSSHVLKDKGRTVEKTGYWGDIVNSPYIAFGIKSSNEELFKTHNNKHIKSSVDVSLHNITALIYKLTTGEEYSKSTEPSIQEVKDEVTDGTSWSLKSFGVSFHLLPLSVFEDLARKSKYKNLFHVAYFSSSMVHQMKEQVTLSFKNEAVIMIESAKFILDLNKDQLTQYTEKVTTMASDIGYRPMNNNNPGDDDDKDPDHILFQKSKA